MLAERSSLFKFKLTNAPRLLRGVIILMSKLCYFNPSGSRSEAGGAGGAPAEPEPAPPSSFNNIVTDNYNILKSNN